MLVSHQLQYSEFSPFRLSRPLKICPSNSTTSKRIRIADSQLWRIWWRKIMIMEQTILQRVQESHSIWFIQYKRQQQLKMLNTTDQRTSNKQRASRSSTTTTTTIIGFVQHDEDCDEFHNHWHQEKDSYEWWQIHPSHVFADCRLVMNQMQHHRDPAIDQIIHLFSSSCPFISDQYPQYVSVQFSRSYMFNKIIWIQHLDVNQYCLSLMSNAMFLLYSLYA